MADGKGYAHGFADGAQAGREEQARKDARARSATESEAYARGVADAQARIKQARIDAHNDAQRGNPAQLGTANMRELDREIIALRALRAGLAGARYTLECAAVRLESDGADGSAADLRELGALLEKHGIE